jgi:NAD(P)-dependent dehydrogenase (short-subunit alcohol dehydrogenase family)
MTFIIKASQSMKIADSTVQITGADRGLGLGQTFAPAFLARGARWQHCPPCAVARGVAADEQARRRPR